MVRKPRTEASFIYKNIKIKIIVKSHPIHRPPRPFPEKPRRSRKSLRIQYLLFVRTLEPHEGRLGRRAEVGSLVARRAAACLRYREAVGIEEDLQLFYVGTGHSKLQGAGEFVRRRGRLRYGRASEAYWAVWNGISQRIDV